MLDNSDKQIPLNKCDKTHRSDITDNCYYFSVIRPHCSTG